MTCIFCQIVAHELPADIVYEDKELAVFKDINPDAPVHLLIVPKRHFDSLNSLDEETANIAAKMFITAKRMAEAQGIQSGSHHDQHWPGGRAGYPSSPYAPHGRVGRKPGRR